MADYIRELKALMKAGEIQAVKTAWPGIEERPGTDQEQVIELLALAKENQALDLISFLLAQSPGDHPFHKRSFSWPRTGHTSTICLLRCSWTMQTQASALRLSPC